MYLSPNSSVLLLTEYAMFVNSAGYFGGCFSATSGGSAGTGDVLIFSPRPGLRLWRCNVEGTVQATHMYKELLPSTATIKLNGETSRVFLDLD